MELEVLEFSLESVIGGHHVYCMFKAICTPVSGELLEVMVEEGNSEDQYAVGIYKSTILVGHVPRELSRTFISHGGSI